MDILKDFIAEVKKFGVHKIAKISGVPANTIYEWTRGKNIPTLVNAQKVANAMGMEFLLFDMVE